MCLKLVVDDATKKCFDLISSSSEFTLSAVIFHRVWSLLRNFYRITHTHIRLTALCPGLPRWASSRKVKPIWILLKQETVSGSGIDRAVCKSAPRTRQITTPAPHYSVFYRPDALPAAQPTVSKHWRQEFIGLLYCILLLLLFFEFLFDWRFRSYPRLSGFTRREPLVIILGVDFSEMINFAANRICCCCLVRSWWSEIG